MVGLQGLKIRERRRERKLTQQQVADRLGVTVQAVSQWERGKTIPGGTHLVELYKLLGISLHPAVSDFFSSRIDPMGTKTGVSAPLVSWDSEGWRKAGKLDPSMVGPRHHFVFEVHWKPVGDIYSLKVEEEGMSPEFNSGDIVIIDTGRAPEPGDFVVAVLDESARAFLAIYRPRGVDVHRAPVFDLEFREQVSPVNVSAENPGRVIGTVREHRRFFRTS